MSASMLNTVDGTRNSTVSPVSAVYLPSLPLNALASTDTLDQYADLYRETLLLDVFSLGSMLGFSLGSCSVSQGAHYILQLLYSGFAYVVGSGGKLMGLMNLDRSMIFLGNGSSSWLSKQRNSVQEHQSLLGNESNGDNAQQHIDPVILPASLAKRLKEMPRIFRNKIAPGKKLSLRLNSNFDLSLHKLRAHHGVDCWVDEHLEAVWRFMTLQAPPQLLISNCGMEMS